MRIRIRPTLFPAPAVVLALALPTLAQEPGSTPASDPPSTRAPAQEARPAAFVTLRTGAGVTLANEQGTTLGSVRDHVVDPLTGELQHVVLALASDDIEPVSVLVPYRLLRWDARTRSLRLPLGPEELRALDRLESLELDRRPLAEGARPADGETREATSARGPRRALASTLSGPRVLADGAAIGRAGALVLDVHGGHLAYLLVETPGEAQDPLVVPFEVLRWVPPGEEQAVYHLEATGRAATAGPRLESADPRKLEVPEVRARVRSHFGLPAEPVPAEADPTAGKGEQGEDHDEGDGGGDA